MKTTDIAPNVPTSGTISLSMFYGASKKPPEGLRLDYVTSNTAEDVTSITIPAEAQVGDIAVLLSYCRGLASTGGNAPAGWTKITDLTQGSSSTGIRALAAYKVLVSGDPGSTITGLIYGGQAEAQHVRIYRKYDPGNVGSGVQVSTPSAQGTTGTPTNQTIANASDFTGYVAIAMYSGSGTVSVRGFTPAATTENSMAASTFFVKTKVYTAEDTHAAITVSMSDTGSNNILQSFWIRVPSIYE